MGDYTGDSNGFKAYDLGLTVWAWDLRFGFWDLKCIGLRVRRHLAFRYELPNKESGMLSKNKEALHSEAL